jgi:hypothetical protein
VSRAGGVEQQGADMLLLRAGTGAAVEYDIVGVGGGRRKLRVEQYALAAEPKLALGLRILVDDRQVGDMPAFTSGGRDGGRVHEVELELPRDARRLRLATLHAECNETHARIRRVQVVRLRAAPSANPAKAAAKA